MGWPTSTTSNCSEAAIADVRALPGIRFAARDLTSLVAPPYDVIADAEVSRFEALWFLYDAPGKKVDVGRATPGLEFQDSAGLQQRLWVIRDERWIDELRQMLAASPVLIADGHHRYETTLAYSEEIDGAADAA